MKYSLIVLMLLFALSASTQDSTNPPRADTTFTDVVPGIMDEPVQLFTRKEFVLGFSTLLVIAISIPVIFLFIQKRNLQEEQSIKLLISVLIILSTLFLVVAGFSDQSIAPAFGLFGAILGYVFGKAESKNTPS